jgi:hypothetical integral membrane protein (TIGR02206 family)
LTLAVIACLALATRPLARKAKRTGVEHGVAYLLAVLLAGFQIVQTGVLIGVIEHPWTESLPLHLCQMNMFVCAAMLARRSYRVFEVAYFWGIGGSVAAILTPDLAVAFPEPAFLVFFSGHALTIISVLFAVSAYAFRPRFRSIGITIVVTLLYMLCVMSVNSMLDTNYMYLRTKPAGASIMDHLGPWPWYIAGAVGVGTVVCLLCYAPFAFRVRRRPRNNA